MRVLTRGLPPGESRHDPGTGVPGVTRVGWKPDGQSGPWAAAHRRRRRGHQSRRGGDCRQAVDAAAQGGAARQPHRSHAQPGGRHRVGRDASAGVHQRQRRRLLRRVGRRAEDRSGAARRRLPRAPLRGLGSGSTPRGERRDARGPASVGRRARADRRRAREDDHALSFLRRRTDRIGAPVHVVDPSHRLGRDGAVDRGDAGRGRPDQRDRSRAGHEPRVRARARTRAAPAEPACRRPASR